MFQKIRDRYQEFKTDHDLDSEDVAYYSIITAGLAGLAALVVTATVQEAKLARKQNEWATSELQDGRQVWRLEDGSLISTESVNILI
jgi:hypothetical protein